MAWPKLKQYLENSWYRWASQDRQTWYAAQFQYWENVNIRDMKNGVLLSWWTNIVKEWFTDPFSFFTYSWDLYSVDSEWIVYDSTRVMAKIFSVNFRKILHALCIQKKIILYFSFRNTEKNA